MTEHRSDGHIQHLLGTQPTYGHCTLSSTVVQYWASQALCSMHWALGMRPRAQQGGVSMSSPILAEATNDAPIGFRPSGFCSSKCLQMVEQIVIP